MDGELAGQTDILQCVNFGFTIPSGATIDGITVEIQRKSSGTQTSDFLVQLYKGGTLVGSDKASATAYTTSLVTASYGGASDLWGTTWTYSDINGSTFGVALQCQYGGASTRTASVDFIRVTVDYTESGGGSTYNEEGSGGATVGGTASIMVLYIEDGSGGAAVAGDAEESLHGVVFEEGSGGVLVGGDGLEGITDTPPTIEDCACGYQIYDEAPSGGATIGGTSTDSQAPNRYSEVGSGGVLVSPVARYFTNQVFDGYSGVFHLQEQGDGTANEYLDSSFHNNGTGGVDPYTPTQTLSTLWNYSNAFDGNDYIRLLPDGASESFTVSLWFKITGKYMTRVFFTRGRTDTENGEGISIALGHYFYAQGFTSTTGNKVFARVKLVGDEDWNSYTLNGATHVDNECWHHLALVFDSGNSLTLYLDGEVEKTTAVTETEMVPTTHSITFGRGENAEYADAELQEIRFIPEAKKCRLDSSGIFGDV
jgi:hypothetical protein